MDKKRLNAVIDELTSIIDEMQGEVNDFMAVKSRWYERQLELYRSGLISHEDFDRKVWKEHQTMHTCFDDDLYALQRLALCLDKRYENFRQLQGHFGRIALTTKFEIPEGLKEFEVEYKDSGCACNETELYITKDAEEAKRLCLEQVKRVFNEVDIIEVREVSHD